jgi:hypothetical protein
MSDSSSTDASLTDSPPADSSSTDSPSTDSSRAESSLTEFSLTESSSADSSFAYVFSDYPYDEPSSTSPYRITGRVVKLGVSSNTFRLYGSSLSSIIRVIDFIVEPNVSDEATVEVWIYDHMPSFEPAGRRMKQLEADNPSSPFKYCFDVPKSGEPDFKWGINDPDGTGTSSPPYTLRVTVKRK